MPAQPILLHYPKPPLQSMSFHTSSSDQAHFVFPLLLGTLVFLPLTCGT
jgi:hypothetical protein